MSARRTNLAEGIAPKEGRAALWPVGAIVAAAGMAYANSFSGPLFFDDTASIVQNESIRHLGELGKVLFAPDGAGTAGRPLLNLSFALNYAVGGLAPAGYHVVNLLIHMGAALALFGVVRRTLGLPWAKGAVAESATELAALVAVLWAVHPLQTESVTYVSQRAESMVGLFYLLTWYAFWRAAEPGAGRRWGAVSVAACVAGVLTKEIIVTAPVVMLGFDAVFLSGSWREAWRRRRGIYLGYAGAWMVLAALMVGSRLLQRGIGFGGTTSWLRYVATEAEAVALYLKLIVWPHPLVVDYGLTPARGGFFLVVGVVVVVGWIAGVVVAWKRSRPLAFAGGAVLVMLAPTTSVVPVVFQPIAEHRMYLPLALVLTGLVVGAFAWWGRRVCAVAGVVAGVGLIGLTLARNADYAAEETIWRGVIAARPDNWRAYNALANALFEKGRMTEGITVVEGALRLNPTEGRLYNNYANALSAAGRLPEALVAAAKAAEYAPDYAEGHSSYAAMLLKAQRVPEAAEQLMVARKLKPESAEIRSNLSNALRLAGRAPEAVAEGTEAVRLKPEFAEARGNLGLALVDAGNAGEAVAQLEEAVRLRPDYLDGRNNLGVTLMNLGRLPEAQAQLTEAIKRKADFVEAHNSLGIVLAKLGRLREAQAEFETVLRLQPGHAGATGNMAVLRGMMEGAGK